MSTASLDEKQASPVQDGTVMIGDEAELARMGYKQELRYVQKHTTFQFISETGQTAGATSVCFRCVEHFHRKNNRV